MQIPDNDDRQYKDDPQYTRISNMMLNLTEGLCANMTIDGDEDRTAFERGTRALTALIRAQLLLGDMKERALQTQDKNSGQQTVQAGTGFGTAYRESALKRLNTLNTSPDIAELESQ